MPEERIISLYVVFPTDLMDTPIPMERMAYTGEDGETHYYTANMIWPHARKSLDGSHAIVSFSSRHLEKELLELQNFPDRERLKILSWVEARELMQTPEWTEGD